jgi:16S rRNA C967 or C1407 C5-methylase (RsmB/RsmF family)
MQKEHDKKTSIPADFIPLLKDVTDNWQQIVDCIVESEAYTTVKPNRGKASTQQLESYLPTTDRVPWHPHARYVHPRPNFTLDPLFHAGAYYVQEPSGLVLASIGLPTDRPLTVLDACAAPGGKTTTLLDLLAPGTLVVANEVIPNRNATLRDTVLKWGNLRCIVTRSKLETFVASPQTRFDVVLLDAPCSGEGLWRRNPEAIQEWSLEAVHRSVHLQRQLLAQAAQLVLPDGWLIYSTCTFNLHENIRNAHWFQEQQGADWLPQRLEQLTGFGFTEFVDHTTTGTPVWGYAALPPTCRGEGFFMAAWKKSPQDVPDIHAPSSTRTKKGKTNTVSKVQTLGLGQVEVLETADKQLFTFAPDVQHVLDKLSAGGIHVTLGHRALGRWAGKDWIPEPDWVQLADYPQLLPDQPLDYLSTLRYLARQELAPDNWSVPNGWCTVSYQGIRIGLCKKMPSRINNSWPNRLRILQALPDTNPFEK